MFCNFYCIVYPIYLLYTVIVLYIILYTRIYISYIYIQHNTITVYIYIRVYSILKYTVYLYRTRGCKDPCNFSTPFCKSIFNHNVSLIHPPKICTAMAFWIILKNLHLFSILFINSLLKIDYLSIEIQFFTLLLCKTANNNEVSIFVCRKLVNSMCYTMYCTL